MVLALIIPALQFSHIYFMFQTLFFWLKLSSAKFWNNRLLRQPKWLPFHSVFSILFQVVVTILLFQTYSLASIFWDPLKIIVLRKCKFVDNGLMKFNHSHIHMCIFLQWCSMNIDETTLIYQGNSSIFIFDAMYLYICVSYHYIDSCKYFVKEFHLVLFPFPYKTLIARVLVNKRGLKNVW